MIVCDHDNSGSLTNKLFEQRDNMLGRFWIKVAGRFFTDQNLRIIDQRTRNSRALLVSTGQLARKLLSGIGYPNQVQQFQRALAAFPIAELEPSKPEANPDANSEWIDPLSEREREVLELIAEGLTNQKVATRLFLSLNTVKVHARNINSTLGVNNRTQAVAKARLLGILSTD